MPPARERDRLISQAVPLAEAERRLGPALDVLFGSENPRPALKIATQAESKRPGWPAARAVKALALKRLGRRDEAHQVALNVLSDLEKRAVPVDEDAAAKLHLFFRESPRQERLSARAYDAVAKGVEWDSYLWETAFFWHLRARDFVAAQKVAAALQRAGTGRPKAEYAFWSTVSIWLGNRGSSKNDKLDALACAMLKKALSCSPVPTAEQVRFAVRLFCGAGKFSSATFVLEEEGVVIDASEVAHLRADVAFQAGDTRAAVELYRLLLLDGDSDDWGHWLRLIDLTASDPQLLSATEDLIRDLCGQAGDSSHASRGQFLADLELRRRRGDWSGLRTQVVQYFERFGGKTVCAQDLRPYVATLACREGAAKGFGATLCMELSSGSRKNGAVSEVTANGISKHAVEKDLNVSRLKLWLDCLDDTPSDLRRRYEDTVDESIEPTERQSGDDYILLAAHKLLPFVAGKSRYGSLRNVWKAILLLEAGLARSPFNFHFKLVLIELYSSFGGMQRSFDLWASLDVKHVQVATLSYLVTRGVLNHQCKRELTDLENRVDKLWLECEREIPESFSRALVGGSLNAAVEFFEFKERIEKSSSFLEFIICQAIGYAGDLEDAVGIQRAWDVIGDDARILPETVTAPTGLITNDDMRCAAFWDLSLNDENQYRVDHDSDAMNRGTELPPDKQSALLVELLVTRIICRLSARGDLSTEDCDALRECAGQQKDQVPGESDLPANLKYLSKMSLVIISLHTALTGNPSAMLHDLSDQLSYITSVVSEIAAAAIDVNGEKALSPLSFSAAGQLVHETLLLSCTGLTALSKSALGCKNKQCRRDVAAVMTAYTEAWQECGKLLGDLVRPLLRDGETWANACFETDMYQAQDDEPLHHILPRSNLSPGAAEDNEPAHEEKHQVEFVEKMAENLLKMQQTTARRLQASMECSLQKMKMIALT